MEHKEFYRRNLPHWHPPGATFFITFRLAGSLPRVVLDQLAEERKLYERQLMIVTDPAERASLGLAYGRQVFARWESTLDCGSHGPRWLGKPKIADLIVEALHYRDGSLYDLLSFCVMPNHVHTIFTPLEKSPDVYHPVDVIMQSLKSYTAHQANVLLGRKGTFWQDESYDHVVRSGQELERILAYIAYNPVKAGLVDNKQAWPWCYEKP